MSASESNKSNRKAKSNEVLLLSSDHISARKSLAVTYTGINDQLSLKLDRFAIECLNVETTFSI